MKIFKALAIVLATAISLHGEVLDRQLLSYAPVPDGTYTITKGSSTLLDFLKSRSDLSTLAEILNGCAGFAQAFDTPTSWSYTFFAPSNTAFDNTGAYFETYAATPKGKWWLGNLIQHHYIPQSKLKLSVFNTSYTRIQTSTYLYVGTQVVGGRLMLNNVSAVTEGDISLTNGIVHIIDHILDPSAQVFEPEVAKTSQGFIAGSCSNPALPYC